MKKLLAGILVIILCFSLAACAPQAGPTTGNPTSEPTIPQPTGGINHLNNFVSNIGEGAQLRAYNELFDEMIQDFSAADATGESNYLRVVVDNLLPDAPNSADAAIYKMATGVYSIQDFDGIGFKMRKVGDGKLDLSNLILALRGDDAYDVFEIKLADAVNSDGEALPELTNEYKDFVVCPNLSIENDATEYQLAGNAGNSGTKVLDKILGFHLYLTGECAQILEIEEVFLVKGTDRALLDVFNRERVNKADDTCWWRDSKGFIVQRGARLVDGAKYTFDATATTGANIVLNIMGDTTGAKVGGVAWANLKDANGNPVVNAVNGSFNPLVINLANSGITSRNITIESTKEIVVSKIFATDLVDKAPVTVYPLINTNDIAVFDNFNREQSGFDGDYDKSATNPIVTGAGLNYALSYHNGDKVVVTGGSVVFDATEAVDYINFKEGHTVYSAQKYLVLVVKATDGATFDNFRFDVGSGVTYINQMYSAFGLPLPRADATNYPYVDANGYMWLIIDLAESGMVPNANDGFIDFYYSGEGKLYIDMAFYCDEKAANVDEILANTITATNLGGYEYLQGFSAEGDKLVRFVFECADDSTLKTLRIEGSDGAKWFKDGAIIDANGNPIDGNTPLAGLSVVIDLEASGLNVSEWNHIHGGDFDGTVTSGAFTLKVYRLHEKSNVDEILANTITATNLGGYEYLQGFSAEGDKLVKFVFDCADDSTLKTLRIEGNSGAKWFKDGQIVDANGEPIDGNTPLAGLTIVIDLEASDLNVSEWNHIHGGDFDGTVSSGAFTLNVYRLHEKSNVDEILANTITATNLGGYEYLQGFSAEGDKLVKFVFDCADDSTLKTLRIEGSDGAKWFKDGAIIDADGNPIDGNTPLAGLTIVIDLEASGLNVSEWNHIHGGDFDGTVTSGAFTLEVYRLHEKTQEVYDAIMAVLA